MAIKKKLIHFDAYSVFNSQKLSANTSNTSYTVGVNGAVTSGEPTVLFGSICFIKDVQKIWTHAHLYDCSSHDLSDYLTSEEIAAVYATTSAMDTALAKKQDTISDLTAIRAGAKLGETALQSYTEKYTGTITGIKMNGDSKGTSGVVDLGTVITAHQDISGKQDKVLKFENTSASSWVSDSTYEDYPYRCDISCTGVTASMYADVVFDLEQSVSGNYAPLCETKAGVVSIWSKDNTTITIPTIIITV